MIHGDRAGVTSLRTTSYLPVHTLDGDEAEKTAG